MSWNGSNQTSSVGGDHRAPRTRRASSVGGDHRAPRTRRGLLAGLIVVALGGAALWWFVGRGGQGTDRPTTPHKSPGAIAEVKPAKPKPIVPTINVEKPDLVTLPDGTVTNKPKTIAEAVAMVKLKPGFHRFKNVDEVFSKTNDHQIGDYKAPLFKHRVEQHLSLIATRPRDMMMPPMPPLPPGSEQDFEKSCSQIVEIPEDEDSKDTETRLRVEEMKLKIRDYMKNDGMTFSQAYRKIETEHNRLANMTQLYKGAYNKMLNGNSPDAEAFRARANDELRTAGACEFDENGKTINP